MRIDPDAAFAAVATWAPDRRWYPLKGSDVELTLEDAIAVADDVAVLLVGAGGVTLQVPVAVRDEPGEAPIGRVDGGWLVDACHDLDAVHAMLEASPGIAVTGSVPRARAVRVIAGEQSNTSIVGDAETPWIAKVLRVVDEGEHPDVAVTGALTDAGCDRVPALLAATRGSWRRGSVASGGQLAAVSEFVDGATDAWALVREDAARSLRGEERDPIHLEELGSAVAEVHVALAEALGAHEADAQEAARVVDALRERAAWARREARGALDVLSPAIDAHVARLDELRIGTLQRIHGDLHLGQVLRHPERGSLLLDFEGEPLRPLAERLLPEPSERDVAGMLRSFDYAAGSAAEEVGVAASAATAWTRDAEARFLSGYRSVRPVGDDRLVEALMVDKALYEVVLEVRYRPTWLPLPLAALERMLA